MAKVIIIIIDQSYNFVIHAKYVTMFKQHYMKEQTLCNQPYYWWIDWCLFVVKMQAIPRVAK